MGKIILSKAVQRKLGFLYYVDGEGNVCEAPLSRGMKKKRKNIYQDGIQKKTN